jgi:dTDP-4-amino-4,6-dideoxygalactose transaminase
VHGAGRRNALLAYLQECKIGAEVYYPIPLDRQQCFQNIGRGGETCLRSRILADEVLSIPIFPELTPTEREEVATAIEAFTQKA